MKYILTIFIWGLVSCASLEQDLDPKIYYQNTMRMAVKGDNYDRTFHGVGVLPYSTGGYKIEISNPNRGRLDFVRFSSCHRERTYNSEGKHLTIRYIPSPIETSGSCLLKFESYSVKGKHGWGILDMQTRGESLNGKVRCNGQVIKGPVTTCQSRAGLIQQISFSEEVTIGRQQARCKISETGRFKLLRFKIPARECIYVFRGDSGRFHRLTTIGYESVLIPAGG